MKPSDQPYIPVLTSPWASQSRWGSVSFESGGAMLPGGNFDPRYLLVFPAHYDLVTVGLRTSASVGGYDRLYIRAGGLKADIAQMDRGFRVLFFKNDASSTRALYDLYGWDAPHEEFKEKLGMMEFTPTATVEDVKAMLIEKLGKPFRRMTKG